MTSRAVPMMTATLGGTETEDEDTRGPTAVTIAVDAVGALAAGPMMVVGTRRRHILRDDRMLTLGGPS